MAKNGTLKTLSKAATLVIAVGGVVWAASAAWASGQDETRHLREKVVSVEAYLAVANSELADMREDMVEIKIDIKWIKKALGHEDEVP